MLKTNTVTVKPLAFVRCLLGAQEALSKWSKFLPTSSHGSSATARTGAPRVEKCMLYPCEDGRKSPKSAPKQVCFGIHGARLFQTRHIASLLFQLAT
eukprot:5103729-Pleurochrysis_carterae.AAC.3